MIERDIVGGAAHLWDCIPSKAMVATGNALAELSLAQTMGLEASGCLDVDALRNRISGMEEKLRSGVTSLLESQGVRLIRGTGRLTGAYTVAADTETGTEELEADAILLSTGSRPRVPDWADDRRRTHPHHAPGLPAARDSRASRRHRFRASPASSSRTCSARSASRVTLIVSRQQVLPYKDPEVAAVLEDEFLRRGVKLLKGARAISIGRDERQGLHRLRRRSRGRRFARARCASARSRTARVSGARPAGVEVDEQGYIPGNRHCQTNLPHIYSAGDVSGRLPAVVGRRDAGPQDRRARDGSHRPCAPPPRLRQGRAGDLHRSRDRRGRGGRSRGLRGRAQASGHEGARSRPTRRR